MVSEEIKIELEMIKLSNEEETNMLKDSIKILKEEKNSLKNEVKLLNNAIEGLKKKVMKKKMK